MSAVPEKVVRQDEIQPADTIGSDLANRPTVELVEERSRLLGGTPDEILEAEQNGRTFDLGEAKKASPDELLSLHSVITNNQ